MAMIGGIGLAELMIVLFTLLIPGAIIYLDARKKAEINIFGPLQSFLGY